MTVYYEGGRPYTDGELSGTDDSGNPVTRPKKFLIDSGAAISAIDEDNAKAFKLTVEGGSASGAAGGAMQIVTGVTMRFKRRPHSPGPDDPPPTETEEWVNCAVRCAVLKHGGYSILGQDQRTSTSTILYDDPAHSHGQLGKIRRIS